MRRLRIALATTLTLAVLLAVSGLAFVRRQLPDRAVPRIPGLSADVTVSFDGRGIARVSAKTFLDALRVQGYLTARDRLFQLEMQRRVAGGELSELFGPAALPLDREHRTYGFANVAKAAVPLLPENERAALTALTDGLNAFLDSHRERLGLEFALLRCVPRTFTESDSLLVLLLMWEDLATSWKAEATGDALRTVSPSVRAFLGHRATGDDVLLTPDLSPLSGPSLSGVVATQRLALGVRSSPFETAEDEASDETVKGSNSWVVSGRLTRSGRAMLANDPHLTLGVPGIWLPMRFEIGGKTLEGVTLPGLPGVIIGRTDEVAWGYTNLGTDVQDLYREDLATAVSRTETIKVRGRAPETLVVRSTRHGPIVKDGLALAWPALDPRNLRLPALTEAMDEAGFPRVFDSYGGPAQNVVWATRGGAIGWRATGLVPIRRPGTDGSAPYDGNDPENDWKGYVPPSELPSVVNPEEGFLVTANQRVIGSSYPHVVATDWPGPARARRIRDLLRAAGKDGRLLDRQAMEGIQLDVVSETLRELVEALRPHLPEELAAWFVGWDGRATRDSTAFLLARALRKTLRESLLESLGATGWPGGLPDEHLLTLLRADAETWLRIGLPDRTETLTSTAAATLKDLRARLGSDPSRWLWGKENRLRARHPLGRVPGLRPLFDPPSSFQAGAPAIVRAQSPTFGQSMRFIVDWGEPDAATLVVPFGVSGHVGSPHRLDQLTRWLEGDPDGRETRLAAPAVGDPLVFRGR